jgi:hypothetical protein
MIKLKNILNEVSIPTKSGAAYFTATVGEAGVIFIAKSSKDLDVLEDVADSDIKKLLVTYLNKKFNVLFIIDNGYRGAGYYFKIDLYDIVKKIN